MGCPAVASRVGEVSLATVIQGSRAFHDGCAILLPALGGLRENLGGANLTRRSEWCNAKRLEVVRHAGPDKVVAPAAEANDAAIDTPGVGQGCEVSVRLERIGTAYDLSALFLSFISVRG